MKRFTNFAVCAWVTLITLAGIFLLFGERAYADFSMMLCSVVAQIWIVPSVMWLVQRELAREDK